MNASAPWLLPEGMDELLPPQAASIERLSRSLLDLCASWGYELVIPPMVEFLDSLLTGTAEALGLQTFNVTDHLSGRQLGIRADITPQVARIDAKRLGRATPVRLCYLGTVLHARAEVGESRCPLQLGAELFGHRGLESDAEVLTMALETLRLAGVSQARIGLGHPGLVRLLLSRCNLDEQRQQTLHGIMQRKACDELAECTRTWSLPAREADALAALLELHGGPEVLSMAMTRLAGCGPEVLACVGELQRLVELMGAALEPRSVHFELCEMHGHEYHTGIVFAAYLPGHGGAVLHGGRYDNIGRAFGRLRPATGFSTDVKLLAAANSAQPAAQDAILAPWPYPDAALAAEVARLRRAGETVINALPGVPDEAAHTGCNRRLEKGRDGAWQVCPD